MEKSGLHFIHQNSITLEKVSILILLEPRQQNVKIGYNFTQKMLVSVFFYSKIRLFRSFIETASIVMFTF